MLIILKTALIYKHNLNSVHLSKTFNMSCTYFLLFGTNLEHKKIMNKAFLASKKFHNQSNYKSCCIDNILSQRALKSS